MRHPAGLVVLLLGGCPYIGDRAQQERMDRVDCEHTFYVDADDDGAGDPSRPVEACDPPPYTTDNADDCDDLREQVGPRAAETCDGLDNDCDGSVDEQACDEPDPDPEYTGDLDEDGQVDVCDNCPFLWNPDQDDQDGDGLGDTCDRRLHHDKDGDALPDPHEDREGTDKEDHDTDDDGLGDALELWILGTDPLEWDSDGLLDQCALGGGEDDEDEDDEDDEDDDDR